MHACVFAECIHYVHMLVGCLWQVFIMECSGVCEVHKVVCTEEPCVEYTCDIMVAVVYGRHMGKSRSKKKK